MGKTYVGTGTASKDGVIRLDTGDGLPAGRVRVIVEPERPVGKAPRKSILDIPQARPGRDAADILRDLRALRDEWDERA